MLKEGICDSNTAPSTSSISRLLRGNGSDQPGSGGAYEHGTSEAGSDDDKKMFELGLNQDIMNNHSPASLGISPLSSSPLTFGPSTSPVQSQTNIACGNTTKQHKHTIDGILAPDSRIKDDCKCIQLFFASSFSLFS